MSGTSDTPGAYGADSRLARGYRVDPYTGAVRMEHGMGAARAVRLMAAVCIIVRLFTIYAAANRISVSRTLLHTANQYGELAQYDSSTFALANRAQDADNMATTAFVLLVATFVIFFGCALWLLVRANRGDLLARAVYANRANRVVGPLYLVAAVGAVTATNVFKARPDMAMRVRWNDVLDLDVANICVQVVVIAFLLILGIAVNREIEAAYTDTRDL